jgi:hypothetical protein
MGDGLFFSLEYTVRGLFTRGEVTLSHVVGTAFALSLISAATISVDRVGENSFLLALNETCLDAVIWSPGNYDVYASEMEASPGMETVVPVVTLGHSLEVLVDGGGGIGVGRVLAVDSRFSELALRTGFNTNASFDLGPREILLSEDAAISIEGQMGDEADLREGDNLSLRLYHGHTFRDYNFTLVGVYGFDRSVPVNCAEASVLQSKMVIGFDTGREMLELMGAEGWSRGYPVASLSFGLVSMPSSAVLHLAKVDRSSFVDTMSLERTLDNLDEIVFSAGDRADVLIEFYAPLVESVDYYNDVLSGWMNTLLLASLPVILLGMYLGVVGMDLSQTQRKREIGLLRCRGFTDGQISRMIVLESVVLGCLGGILGVVIGFFLSSFVTLPGFESISMAAVPGVPLFLAGALLGSGMMIVASLRAVRRLGRERTTELLSGYSAKISRDRYRGRLDLALVLVPLSIHAMIQLGFEGEYTGAMPLIEMIFIALFAAGIILLPFTSVMMAFGITRLLTRGGHRIYSALCMAISPVGRGMGRLIESSVLRNPKRSSSISLLLALAIALGTFVVILPATEEQKNADTRVCELGADIKIGMQGSESFPVEKIEAIEGVTAACRVEEVRDGSRIFALVDPEKLRICIRENPYYTEDVAEALDTLTEREDVLIPHQPFLKDHDIGPGSRMSIGYGDDSVTLELTGSFPYIPGVSQSLYHWEGLNVFLGHIHMLPGIRRGLKSEGVSSSSSIILVKISEDSDLASVTGKVEALVGGTGTVKNRDLPWYRQEYLVPFTKVELALTMAIASLGVALITWMGLRERRQETAQQLARGVSRRQILVLLLGETFVIAVVGLVIGLFAGYIPPYLYILSLVRQESLLIPVHLAVPPLAVILPLVAFASICLVPLLAVAATRTLRIHEVLRVRH